MAGSASYVMVATDSMLNLVIIRRTLWNLHTTRRKTNVYIIGMIEERKKSVLMILGLAHQLSAWIDFARSMGHMTRLFKYESGVLSSQCKKFINTFEGGDDLIYEHSVQISDLFEEIAKMDDQDIKRVLSLINKMRDQRTRKSGQ